MPTRIVMANGEHLSVSDSLEKVAEQLAGGALTRLDRPWGDTAIYVNPSAIAYLEAQDERNPDIEALEATETAPATGAQPPGGPIGGGPGGPGGGAPGAPHPGGPPNPR